MDDATIPELSPEEAKRVLALESMKETRPWLRSSAKWLDDLPDHKDLVHDIRELMVKFDDVMPRLEEFTS